MPVIRLESGAFITEKLEKMRTVSSEGAFSEKVFVSEKLFAEVYQPIALGVCESACGEKRKETKRIVLAQPNLELPRIVCWSCAIGSQRSRLH